MDAHVRVGGSECRQFVEFLPWYVNGSLELVQCRSLRKHLIYCADCRLELRKTRMVLSPKVGHARPFLGSRARRPRPIGWKDFGVAASLVGALILVLGVYGSDDHGGNPSTRASGDAGASSAETIFSDGFENGDLDSWPG